jgi:pimeloyl-ACP methyl ester carboxylesterase
MPTFTREDASLWYDVIGGGFPVLLFAPGGMRSRDEMWHSPAGGPQRVWHDWTKVLPEAGYRVVTMDQRNAGRSRTPIAGADGWHSYAADHLALMDHLGIERFHVLGGCIGASFCLRLCQDAPDRVAAAVLQNPIGLNPEAPAYFPEGFAEWAKEQCAARPDLDPAAVAQFGRNMWSGDFVYAVDRKFVRRCAAPCIVLPGSDKPHPAVTGDELRQLLPNAEYLKDWKGPAHLAEQKSRVLVFLAKHTPMTGT